MKVGGVSSAVCGVVYGFGGREPACEAWIIGGCRRGREEAQRAWQNDPYWSGDVRRVAVASAFASAKSADGVDRECKAFRSVAGHWNPERHVGLHSVEPSGDLDDVIAVLATGDRAPKISQLLGSGHEDGEL